MRVTMQFICVLQNLHVKEARGNNGYLRRAAFFAVSTWGVPENIASMLSCWPTNGFPSARSDLSLSFRGLRTYPTLKGNSCSKSCATFVIFV